MGIIRFDWTGRPDKELFLLFVSFSITYRRYIIGKLGKCQDITSPIRIIKGKYLPLDLRFFRFIERFKQIDHLRSRP